MPLCSQISGDDPVRSFARARVITMALSSGSIFSSRMGYALNALTRGDRLA
jgi:hypothetical protein